MTTIRSVMCCYYSYYYYNIFICVLQRSSQFETISYVKQTNMQRFMLNNKVCAHACTKSLTSEPVQTFSSRNSASLSAKTCDSNHHAQTAACQPQGH